MQVFRRTLVISFLVVPAIACLRTVKRAQPVADVQQECLPPGPITGLRYETKALMDRTDEMGLQIFRIRALERVPVSEVEIVTSNATCQRAALAYARNLGVSPSRPRVHVVKVGARYLVVDLRNNPGWLTVVTFDQSFDKALASWAY